MKKSYEYTLDEYIRFKINKMRSRKLNPKYIIVNVDDYKQLEPLKNIFGDTDGYMYGLRLFVVNFPTDPIVGV